MRIRSVYLSLGALICFLLLCFGVYNIYFYYQEKPEVGQALPEIAFAPGQTRLLVIAPHCDDETLGCGGIIQEVVGAGGEVMVVAMTNGDGFTFAAEEQFHHLFLTQDDYIKSGYLRQNEFIWALQRLGVAQNRIIFLGYPDRGLGSIWAEHWDSTSPYQSRYTGKAYSPYSNSYSLNTPYSGKAVMDDLESIIRKFKPSLIFLPHPDDEHIDHAATWAFTSAVVIKVTNNGILQIPRLYTYLVHRGGFPIPHGYRPEAALLPPKPMYQKNSWQWEQFTLTSDQESVKEAALNEYGSQLRVPIMSKLLRSFIRRNELFEKVDIPLIIPRTSAVNIADVTAWETQKPELVYPKTVSALGALEHKARVRALACAVQDSSLWLYFYIPDFSMYFNQYQVSVIGFRENQNMLNRTKNIFSFSMIGADVAPENIKRFNDAVIINIPFSEQGLPDYFFIRIQMKDRFGATIDHTAWQPVKIQHVANK